MSLKNALVQLSDCGSKVSKSLRLVWFDFFNHAMTFELNFSTRLLTTKGSINVIQLDEDDQ